MEYSRQLLAPLAFVLRVTLIPHFLKASVRSYWAQHSHLTTGAPPASFGDRGTNR